MLGTLIKTSDINTETIITNALTAIKQMIAETDFADKDDVLLTNTTVPIDSNFHIFINYGYNSDFTEFWLWFSLEKNDRNGWEDSIDEQDTSDLTTASIEYNLRLLLERVFSDSNCKSVNQNEKGM